MPEIEPFAKVAPYLVNPLVLIGFCLFLFFGIHWALLRAGVLTPLSQRQSSAVVRVVLKYGLWVAIIIIVLGFIYAYHNVHQGSISQQTNKCGSNVAGDNNEATVNCVDK